MEGKQKRRVDNDKERQESQKEKKSNKKSKTSSQIPDNEEIIELNEANALFQNNLFKLQTDELLNEVRIKYQKISRTETALKSLKNYLENMPEKQLKSIPTRALPFLLYSSDSSIFPLSYKPPTSIHVIGSFLLKTIARPNVHVDLAIQINDSYFSSADLKNYRYHDKRNLYLKYVHDQLKSSEAHELNIGSITFKDFNGDPHKQILEIKLKADQTITRHDISTIRIFPITSESLFPITKLLPNHNNLSIEGGESEQRTNSSEYNSSILEDGLIMRHLKLLHNAVSRSPSLIDCIQLLKVWIRQRELDSVAGPGFNGFLASMILLYLLDTTKAINVQMSSYQMLKICLNFLKDNLNNNVNLFMEKQNALTSNSDHLFRGDANSRFCLVDSSGAFNLLWRFTTAGANEVAFESHLALKMLQDPVVDNFHHLFLHTVPFHSRCDMILCINDLAKHIWSIHEKEGKSKYIIMDYAVEKIILLLKKGLGNRCRLLLVRRNLAVSKNEKESETVVKSLVIGFVFNSAFANKNVDMGPAADDVEKAEEFRKFWGDKSELRSFKDGSIAEAVVWLSSVTNSSTHLIPALVVRHLLSLHFSITEPQLSFAIHQFDWVLDTVGDGMHDNDEEDLTGEQASMKVVATFDSLCKKLRSLNNIPLAIRNIQHTHAAFRYTDSIPPTPNKLLQGSNNRYDSLRGLLSIPSLDFVLQFESSGRWPDDLEAIRKIKTALLVRFAKQLDSQHHIKSRITEEYLDILFEGYSFRMRIRHDREISFIEAQESIEQAIILKRNLITKAAHAGRVQGFNSRYRCYGSTVRLVKRWLAANFIVLPNQLAEEAIELICMYLFLHPYPYTIPSTSFIGLLRFLWLFSTHNWDELPLLVDEENEITAEKYGALLKSFQESRNLGLGGAITILSPQDERGWEWTLSVPDQLTLNRITELARSCLNCIDAHLTFGNLLATKKIHPQKWWKQQLFSPPLAEFDILVYLKPEAIPLYEQRCFQLAVEHKPKSHARPTFKNLRLKSVNDIEIGFDPIAMFCKDLKNRFEDSILISRDVYGGEVIAIAMNPKSLEPVPLNARTAQCRAPSSLPEPKKRTKQTVEPKKQGQELVKFNIYEFLDDIQTLGEGIVAEIKVANASLL